MRVTIVCKGLNRLLLRFLCVYKTLLCDHYREIRLRVTCHFINKWTILIVAISLFQWNWYFCSRQTFICATQTCLLGLHKVVPRCPGRFIYSKLNCPGLSNTIQYQSLRRRSTCSWAHLCLHSTCNIHWYPCLSHLPAIEAHQAVEEGSWP